LAFDDAFGAAQAAASGSAVKTQTPSGVVDILRGHRMMKDQIATLSKPTTVEFLDLPREDCSRFP